MEISIITVFGSYNHGSYLQALNLSKALSKYGNVQFIDYNTRQWNAFRTAYRRTKLFLRSSGQYNKFAKIACFEIREAMIIKKLWKKTVHSDKFSGDVCVLGSDEIWNIKRSVCRYPVYWGDGIACPKIAYAPSINNSTDDEFEKNAQYITYLNNIDSISVRDRHSQEVMFGRDIYFTSYLYAAGLTFLFSILVNAVMSFKIKAVNMVESLKSVE